MAWLSGLADKAENLLNKIDKNTAAVLNKDKYELSQPQLTEVTWNPPEPRHANTCVTNSPVASSRHFPHIRSTPNLASLATTTTVPYKDDELLTFLNTPDASPRKLATDNLISPPTPSSLIVEHPTDTTDSISDMSLHSNCSSPHFDSTTVKSESEEHQIDANVATDETYVYSGVQLPSTVVENQVIEVIEQDEEAEKDPEPSSSNETKKCPVEVQRNVGEKNQSVGKQETDYQKEIIVINEKLENLELEKQELTKHIVDLQTALERSRLEVNSTRSDLEQHKARAFKTLQEKEKLIAELRRNEIAGMDEATAMELDQLRQERDTLREENLHTSEQLRIVREELMNAEIKLEKIRQKTNEANTQAQEILTTERRRRLDAEEDAKTHSEEARSLKDELLRLRSSYTTQLQKQESEIARLRIQLSASSTPSSAVETRLTTLTQTLVMKQQALENLTTERNALRLQLEKIEHEFRNTRRNVSYNNVNDTDDAKAQVPTFLLETPFDTGVTRRVKRAYSSLDAISIRTGVFLRRYPLARILVLIYMALLQFWVLIVLFSQSPDAH